MKPVRDEVIFALETVGFLLVALGMWARNSGIWTFGAWPQKGFFWHGRLHPFNYMLIIWGLALIGVGIFFIIQQEKALKKHKSHKN